MCLDDLAVISYYWEHKIYDLDKMISLVQKKEITKRNFFDITRYVYDAVAADDKRN